MKKKGTAIEEYNYGISAVGYEETHIEELVVNEINEDGTVEDPRTWTVDQIMDELERPKSFATIFWNGKKWIPGRKVGKVEFQAFIRSFPSEGDAKDDLEDLPRMPTPKPPRKGRLHRGARA